MNGIGAKDRTPSEQGNLGLLNSISVSRNGIGRERRGSQVPAAPPPANSRKSELADGAAIGNVTPETAEPGVRHVKLSKSAQCGHRERHRGFHRRSWRKHIVDPASR